jgi:hypothetical protein
MNPYYNEIYINLIDYSFPGSNRAAYMIQDEWVCRNR